MITMEEARREILGWLDEALIRDGKYSSILVEELAAHLVKRTVDVHSVFDQIGRLEDPAFSRGGGVKPATAFNGKLLRGLWHQHYSAPSHLLKNLENDLRSGKAEKTLQNMADAVNNGMNPGCFAHELVLGGYQRRFAADEMTGQWIIFAKSVRGINYYLTLGEHDEGDAKILERVRTCSSEFPELLELVLSLSSPL